MGDSELRVRAGGRPDLADLQPYRAPQLDAAVKLNTNESPYPPHPAFVEDLQKRISVLQLNRYPLRDFPEVKEAVARYAGTLTDRIWLANGSNELLLQLLLAFGGVERKAMVFEPTFPMYGHITRVSGTRLLRARRNADFTLERQFCLQSIDVQAPEVIILCSPNNPTGNSHSPEEIADFCRAAPGIVILDEAYAEFAGGGNAALVEEFENLAVVRSFSKAWRLAGARIGYLIASPWIIDEILKVRLPYHFSSLSQAAALAAVAHREELMATIETIVHERGRVFRELATTGGIMPFPSDANFVLFRTLNRPAGEVWQGLLDRGVLVRDFSDLPGCEDCLRVSIGTAEQNEKFLEALAKALAAPGPAAEPAAAGEPATSAPD
ncbi:MAG: histidinol-phosphate transaminase [Actinomycetota bacterium]